MLTDAKTTPEPRQVWVSPHELAPSPENATIYTDGESGIAELARAVRADGVLEPLVITSDHFIVSGHRRHAAALLATLEKVPCRVLPFRRQDLPHDQYVRLLREFNRQRSKTIADLLREAGIDADPEAAWTSLIQERVKRCRNGHGQFEIEGIKHRARISEGKQPMLQAALAAIESRSAFWPLSVRQIHYCLLGDPPLRHANKPDSRYGNTRSSYQDLCDLLARARIAGLLPWDRIADETRPVKTWPVHPHVGTFAEAELSGLFSNYWRDLQQSQPDHLEIIVEKNSSLGVIECVAMRYCIPVTSGRGYSSKEPLRNIAQRFKRSGKRNLILLLLSDFDPDGDEISNSTAKSLRDDFRISDRRIVAVRVAVRPDQIQRFKLPMAMDAKPTSGSFNKFVIRHGVSCAVELEALRPEDLQGELDKAIRAHMDVGLFNAEVEQEKAEAAQLQTLKRRALEFINQL